MGFLRKLSILIAFIYGFSAQPLQALQFSTNMPIMTAMLLTGLTPTEVQKMDPKRQRQWQKLVVQKLEQPEGDVDSLLLNQFIANPDRYGLISYLNPSRAPDDKLKLSFNDEQGWQQAEKAVDQVPEGQKNQYLLALHIAKMEELKDARRAGNIDTFVIEQVGDGQENIERALESARDGLRSGQNIEGLIAQLGGQAIDQGQANANQSKAPTGARYSKAIKALTETRVQRYQNRLQRVYRRANKPVRGVTEPNELFEQQLVALNIEVVEDEDGKQQISVAEDSGRYSLGGVEAAVELDFSVQDAWQALQNDLQAIWPVLQQFGLDKSLFEREQGKLSVQFFDNMLSMNQFKQEDDDQGYTIRPDVEAYLKQGIDKARQLELLKEFMNYLAVKEGWLPEMVQQKKFQAMAILARQEALKQESAEQGFQAELEVWQDLQDHWNSLYEGGEEAYLMTSMNLGEGNFEQELFKADSGLANLQALRDQLRATLSEDLRQRLLNPEERALLEAFIRQENPSDDYPFQVIENLHIRMMAEQHLGVRITNVSDVNEWTYEQNSYNQLWQQARFAQDGIELKELDQLYPMNETLNSFLKIHEAVGVAA